MSLITSIVTIITITIIILGIIAVIYLPSYADEKIVESWKEEFEQLGEFIRDKEVVNVTYANLADFEIYNRLKITLKDYPKNTEKIFKILNTAQLETRRGTYPIDVRVKEIKCADTDRWKIQLSSAEKADVEHPQHIYNINIFTPMSTKEVEYSSR